VELDKSGSEKTNLSLRVDEIESVQIAQNFGEGSYCNIAYGDGRKLKIHSGAIESFGSPFQCISSFVDFMKALLVRPNPGFSITVGSNGLYWFTLICALITIPLVALILYLTVFEGGVPAHEWWKAIFVVGMLALFGVPLLKIGRAKQVEQLDELPFGLELLAELETKPS